MLCYVTQMPIQINSESKLRASPDVIASDIAGEIVLISIESGRYYGFDPVAAEIWHRLATPTTLGALADSLLQSCSGDPDVVARETAEFVSKLVDRGLVIATNDPVAGV